MMMAGRKLLQISFECKALVAYIINFQNSNYSYGKYR